MAVDTGRIYVVECWSLSVIVVAVFTKIKTIEIYVGWTVCNVDVDRSDKKVE